MCLGLAWTGQAQAQEYFERYDIASQPQVVDMGVQPMAYPLAFISSTMLRDKLLRQDLQRLGMTLRVHPFRKGNDMVKLFGGGKLEWAFLGDMPTVNTLVRTPTVIVGLGKRNFSSVVSHTATQIEGLRGKRIAYSPGSSSHLVLMRSLKSAGIAETDVKLVAMEPSQMVDALESGAVDAYSAWEPTPSISMQRNTANRAIYRGMSTDWVVAAEPFTRQHSAAALALSAAYVRAVLWMRAAHANLERAASWVLSDGESFTGQARALTVAKAMEIARKDLLDVPGAPAVPAKVDGVPPLTREFAFLQELGRLPQGAAVQQVTAALGYNGLQQVQATPQKYRIHLADYDR
jgi:ABC-type nitrate/sulfonate/bicarbonate transport system substrate-binding protein